MYELIVNRAMLHDPVIYFDPLAFKPERFLVQDPPPNPINYAFGFGRRWVDLAVSSGN